MSSSLVLAARLSDVGCFTCGRRDPRTACVTSVCIVILDFSVTYQLTNIPAAFLHTPSRLKSVSLAFNKLLHKTSNCNRITLLSTSTHPSSLVPSPNFVPTRRATTQYHLAQMFAAKRLGKVSLRSTTTLIPF